MLFAELLHPELVHGGGHVLDRLLQVLGITLHQWPGDSAATVLEEGRGHKSLSIYGMTKFTKTTLKRHQAVFLKRRKLARFLNMTAEIIYPPLFSGLAPKKTCNKCIMKDRDMEGGKKESFSF